VSGNISPAVSLSISLFFSTEMFLFRYIRYIYNRVILENSAVRAAAVAAMAQFGANCPNLLENVQVLLARCQMDCDDQVRDRATYYYSILATQNRSLYNSYICEGLQVKFPMSSHYSAVNIKFTSCTTCFSFFREPS